MEKSTRQRSSETEVEDKRRQNVINSEGNGTKVLSPEKKQRQLSLYQEERRFLHLKSTLQIATQINTIHIHENVELNFF